MFTGIVEELGTITHLERRAGATELTARGEVVHEGTLVGDSINLNGVCLTVVRIDGPSLTFEAVPETLRRTNLGDLEVGHAVNLERAVGGGRTFGGHYVQGHVDGVIRVTGIELDGEAKTYRFEAEDPALLRYVVEKGYVTIDGVSLTVVSVDERGFTITLIPHTQQVVTLGRAQPSYRANFEADVTAKYVERLVGPRLAALEAKVAKIDR